MVNVASSYLCTGQDTSRKWGSAHASIVPYQAFPTAGGESIVVAAGTDSQFSRLCGVLGRPEWAKDDRFSTNPTRVSNRRLLVSLISNVLKQRPRQFWDAAFEADGGVPFASVRSMKDALDCVQARCVALADLSCPCWLPWRAFSPPPA
jgi:crotonobetainyl-CoA:carnitine CoA-transferase CaiB-like acyl-CoA transferase